MKIPWSPPSADAILGAADPDSLRRIMDHMRHNSQETRYLHWDDLRHRKRAEGMTMAEEWASLKLLRSGTSRVLPLVSTAGERAQFVLTDEMSQMLMQVDKRCGGNVGALTPFTGDDRDRILVSSLYEEAITSSQLEGANTTRKAAKEMLRTNRTPKTHGERMILNNFLAMDQIRADAATPLTLDSILEIHRLISAETLEDADDEGRFQLEDDTRVGVYWNTNGVDSLIHTPPSADLIPGRMSRLCDFANGVADSRFLHPVLRALTVHFWIGYDHPFVDGNGRLARTLFYRSMLGAGYWLAEFLSISSILRKRPSKYVRSYLLCETDGMDLTYFFIDQLQVVIRALDAFDQYLARRRQELETVSAILRGRSDLNHRQLSLLGRALRHPGEEWTIAGHQATHRVVYESARQDLLSLERLNLLDRFRRGQAYVYVAPFDLDRRLKEVSA